MKCESSVILQCIVPEDEYHYFFGYYDLQPFDADNRRHLAHRTAFADRIPAKDDAVELGYITIEDHVFHKVAESRAWNFQQGALLQWYDSNHIIYNDFRNGSYCSVIKHIESGSERLICAPLAHLSADRKWGLSINFPRVWDFRPGYGYCNTRDPYNDILAPEEDGIFLVDLERNTSRLILSYPQLAQMFPEKPFCDMKLVVNHITFNPSASRFLFLLRNFPEPGKKWGTILVTADRDGGNVRNLTNYEVNSHYHWKDDQTIMIWSALPAPGVYLFDDATGKRQLLENETVNKDDIHCLYSPDRSCFIGDGYWDKDSFRSIYLYDFETQISKRILRIYSEPDTVTDIRCDLHNRFSPDGTLVSFDSWHNGRREILYFSFDKKKLLESMPTFHTDILR